MRGTSVIMISAGVVMMYHFVFHTKLMKRFAGKL